MLKWGAFNLICTVWNFKDIFISQIFREINLADFRSCKTADFFAILEGGSEFNSFGKFQSSKSAKSKIKIKSLQKRLGIWHI